MTIEQIKEMPVARLAADDCAMFASITGQQLALGTHLPILEAWGFTPKTIVFDWIKQNPDAEGLHVGRGGWTLNGTEQVILAIKGSPKRIADNIKQAIFAPVGRHSEKPEEVRRRIEQLVAGPYLELFAHKPVDGWTVWGNEIRPDQMSEAAE
jgi:N6-adenosine-specific RNA methylase IME4